jgi:hypothetical protein
MPDALPLTTAPADGEEEKRTGRALARASTPSQRTREERVIRAIFSCTLPDGERSVNADA